MSTQDGAKPSSSALDSLTQAQLNDLAGFLILTLSQHPRFQEASAELVVLSMPRLLSEMYAEMALCVKSPEKVRQIAKKLESFRGVRAQPAPRKMEVVSKPAARGKTSPSGHGNRNIAKGHFRWNVIEVDQLKRDIDPRMGWSKVICTTRTFKQAEHVAQTMRDYHRGEGRYSFEVEKDEPEAPKRRSATNGKPPNVDAFAPWRITSGGLPGLGKRR